MKKNHNEKIIIKLLSWRRITTMRLLLPKKDHNKDIIIKLEVVYITTGRYYYRCAHYYEV